MTIGWCFDNTYSKLPDPFKEEIKPIPVKNPELVILNKDLSKELNLDFSNLDNKKISELFSGNSFHQEVIVLHKLMQVINLVTLQCWVMEEQF